MECMNCKKYILSGILCPRCRRKLPKGCVIESITDFKTLLSYKCPSRFRFHANNKLGLMKFDKKHFLIKLNWKVYELRYLKDYAISVEHTDGMCTLIFSFSLLYPEVQITTPIARCKLEEEETLVRQINQIMQDMVTAYITERNKVFIPQARKLLDEPDPHTPESYLKKAKSVFYLADSYTLSQLKHQRTQLLKIFHPDNGGKTSDAQKINDYYKALLKNKEEQET